MSTAEKKRYERPVIIRQYSGLMNKLGSRSYTAPVSEIDGVAIKGLTERYGSPLFILSERAIRQNQRRAQRIFKTRYPKVQFAWSYKTNYLSAICSVFHQEGSWSEVVSEFEYDRARKLGMDVRHILFNGTDKSSGALTLRTLQTIRDIAADPSEKIVLFLPSNLSGVVSEFVKGE